MAYFEWKDYYSVRIAQIDAQHKKLVGLLNELYDAMQAGKGKEVLERTLANLVAYSQVHFTKEEELMRVNAYPGYIKHCQEHARFIEQVQDFEKQFQSGKMTLSIQLSGFLKDWLSNHILKTDQQYSGFLISHGVR
jgi:hemerythrin